MKASKFQQALLARSLPVTAVDILEEYAARLLAASRGTFPPGILGSVGVTLQNVLDEAKHVKLQKADAKGKKPKADEAE